MASNANLYEAFGGRTACRELAVAFYARVERDPVLRPLFPGKSFTCAIEEFSAFLAQLLGGPGADSQRRWWLSLRESHMRFKIGSRERDAWMANMIRALDDVRMQEPMRSELLGFFEQSSAHVVNREEAAVVPGGRSGEISRRWKAQTELDEVVAAVRSGDADRAINLAESARLQDYSRSVFCGLLAQMIRRGQSGMLEYVWGKLTGDPALAQERYAGRTLLHEAAAAGNLATVELLLRLGVNPDVLDAGGHTPLYSLANECPVSGSRSVVRALAQAGADVDARGGVKHCTPLHMAARRGHVEVAGALLDCGADIEARDSLGETPLRRAVNCGKEGVAALLVARGADVQTKGSKGKTAIVAAKTPAMKQLLQSGLR